MTDQQQAGISAAGKAMINSQLRIRGVNEEFMLSRMNPVSCEALTRLASGRKIVGHLLLEPFEVLGMPVLAEFEQAKEWTFS